MGFDFAADRKEKERAEIRVKNTETAKKNLGKGLRMVGKLAKLSGRLFGHIGKATFKEVAGLNKEKDVALAKTVPIHHLILDQNEDKPADTWFRRQHWHNQYRLAWDGHYSTNWKVFEADVKVAGISKENRATELLSIINEKDFTIRLKRDPQNPVSKDAVKVYAQGGGRLFHIGYLPTEIGKKLHNQQDLSAVPQSFFVPHNDYNLGVRIKVLVRSAKWKKNKRTTS